jgi:hypothetical protein
MQIPKFKFQIKSEVQMPKLFKIWVLTFI